MLVLGIESSCDETAAAVVRDGSEIISNTVASQIAIHQPYGGVVPELASRHHVQNILPVVDQALKAAKLSLDEIDGIAVTRGPGLVGALLVGVQVAKALSYISGKPLLGVNHLEGHLFSSRLFFTGSEALPEPPERHLALLVSGGHTALFMVEGNGRYRLIGQTRDDAAGEAFDKVAKLLGLGYPGGPIVEKIAKTGDSQAIRFPRPLPRKDDFDFSFSGLKTAVANHVRKHGKPEGQALHDFCASFQQAVVDVLVRKAFRAAQQERAQGLVAAGGVISNGAIRSAFERRAKQLGISLHIPPASLCTDNAAMIAAAGYWRFKAGETSDLQLAVDARLRLQ